MRSPSAKRDEIEVVGVDEIGGAVEIAIEIHKGVVEIGSEGAGEGGECALPHSGSCWMRTNPKVSAAQQQMCGS